MTTSEFTAIAVSVLASAEELSVFARLDAGDKLAVLKIATAAQEQVVMAGMQMGMIAASIEKM
jgi:hypothetical protein